VYVVVRRLIEVGRRWWSEGGLRWEESAYGGQRLFVVVRKLTKLGRIVSVVVRKLIYVSKRVHGGSQKVN
jgi:hypothetical protein